MSTQPEALRLADAIDPFVRPYAPDHLTSKVAAAELRRLYAENASLAAALASSCDEQRHELWESGGIAGCERARVAERQRDALLEALRMFVSCAIPVSTKIDERGYGWTQAYLDQALPKARAAIKAVEETK